MCIRSCMVLVEPDCHLVLCLLRRTGPWLVQGRLPIQPTLMHHCTHAMLGWLSPAIFVKHAKHTTDTELVGASAKGWSYAHKRPFLFDSPSGHKKSGFSAVPSDQPLTHS
jgi:hypothetical protein